MPTKKRLYLAGGLFNAGERLNILHLEQALKALGYEVIVPMREALQHFNSETGNFDIAGIVRSCWQAAADPENLFIGSADGADADSGTCVEYGVAIQANGVAVFYRTDFRTEMIKEVGVNAMLKCAGTRFLYEPCFFTELEQVGPFYEGLAKKIDDEIHG